MCHWSQMVSKLDKRWLNWRKPFHCCLPYFRWFFVMHKVPLFIFISLLFIVFKLFNYWETNYIAGIKCKLKSEHSCYVQALWGVPINSLIELLNEEWESLINAVTTHIPTEKFSSRCICSDSSFLYPFQKLLFYWLVKWWTEV